MAPLNYRQPLVIPARGQHTATVIFAHGLGDSGEGWAPVGAEWSPDLPHVKFVFPNAPMVVLCVLLWCVSSFCGVCHRVELCRVARRCGVAWRAVLCCYALWCGVMCCGVVCCDEI